MEGSFTEEKAKGQGRFHGEGGTLGDAAQWTSPAGPAAAQGPGPWGHIHLAEGLGLAGGTGALQAQVLFCRSTWPQRDTEHWAENVPSHPESPVNQQWDAGRMALQASTSPSVKWKDGGKTSCHPHLMSTFLFKFSEAVSLMRPQTGRTTWKNILRKRSKSCALRKWVDSLHQAQTSKRKNLDSLIQNQENACFLHLSEDTQKAEQRGL